MFCPKCGSQNQDNLSFCRECGEDLKIVSQAMKKNSPVALVSKLDAVIERKNERFRRNAIFLGFAGGTFAIGAIFQALFLTSTSGVMIALPIFAPLFLLFSAWYVLVYLRSLELPATSSGEPFQNENEHTYERSIRATTESRTDQIFCPSCGTRNNISTKFCSSCGQHLLFADTGLARYLPAFIVRRLDSTVANEKDLVGAYNGRWMLLFLAGISLFLLILNAMEGRLDMVLLYAFMLMNSIVISGWDYLIYRRQLSIDEAKAGPQQTSFKDTENNPPKLFPDRPTAEFLENPTVPIGDLDGRNRKEQDAARLRERNSRSEAIDTAKLPEETFESRDD